MQSEGVENLGHGEDHVEVGNGKKLAASSLEPSCAGCGTATRAGAIPAGVPLNVLVTAAVTLLALPAEGGCAACADRTQGFALRSRGATGAQKDLASSSYDRAEVSLGRHASLVRGVGGGAQHTFERTDHISQSRRRDVRVGLGGVNVGVTEKDLHHAGARPLFNQMGGVAMT